MIVLLWQLIIVDQIVSLVQLIINAFLIKSDFKFQDSYGEPLMPDDHGQSEFIIPPCDNSDASKMTATDKSRSSVRHHSLLYNDNLRRKMMRDEFVPSFNDSFTNMSSINYSWCWNSKKCFG